MQHAGNAATALVAAIASSEDRIANDKNMRYLECITAALRDMSEAYQPAERMAVVFDAVLHELKGIHPEHQVSSVVPARRGSSVDPKDAPSFVPSKRNSTTRSRPTAPSLSMMPFQEQANRRSSNALLPSPASSSQVRSDKQQANYGMAADDFVVVDSDLPNLDGGWPIFNGSDPFTLEDGMAHHASPSAFRSVWGDSTTPVFNLGSLDSANRNFMGLLDDPDRPAQGIDIGSPNKGAVSPRGGDLGTSIPGTGESPRGTVCCSEIESSTCNDRSQGNQHSPEKSIGDTRYAPVLGRPDNIWTEIINS